MSETVIAARGLKKLYGKVPAVDGIDLSIQRGEIFGLLGPNGAGKTTTILMILGLTESNEGTITVDGFDPMREPLEVKRRVGYLPDSVGFYDNLTARAYPTMLVKSSYNDSQVMYWEPAKYVARLRALKTDSNPLLLKIKMDPAGHGGASGRYDRLHDTSFEYAWLLSQVGIGK